MIGREKADQAWISERTTLERKVREVMKAKGVPPRDAARVAERVRAEQLGVSKDDVSRLEAAALKRARKAGRVLPQGHSGVPADETTTSRRLFINGMEVGVDPAMPDGSSTGVVANPVGGESVGWEPEPELDPGSAES